MSKVWSTDSTAEKGRPFILYGLMSIRCGAGEMDEPSAKEREDVSSQNPTQTYIYT